MRVTLRSRGTRRAVYLCFALVVVTAVIGGFYVIANRNTFEISGVIVDEAGHALTNALVSYTTSRRIKMGFDSETKSDLTRSDGNFHFRLRGVHHVRLGFVVKGFKYEQRDFTSPGIYRDLRITMERER